MQLVNNSVVVQPSPPIQSARTDAVISLMRTNPLNNKSNYKLLVFADGTVVYEGNEHIPRKGKISQEKLKQLVSESERINYFTLANQYVYFENCPESCINHPCADTGISLSGDDSLVTTSINSNGKSKTVVHYHGCKNVSRLKDLTALENKIDEVVNTKQWIE